MDDANNSSVLPLPISELMCPTAIGTGAWQLYLSSMSYIILGLFAAFELLRCWMSGSSPWSFRTCFFGLCAAFALERGFLNLTPLGPWSPFLMLFFVLLLPIYLQCVTFSLLIVFLARVMLVLKQRGEYVNTYLYPCYAALLIIFFLLNVGYAVVAAAKWRADLNVAFFDQNLSIFWFVEFSIILVTGGFSAVQTLRILHGALLDKAKRRRVKLLFALALALFALFFMRVTWDVLYFANVNPIQEAVGKWIVSPKAVDKEYYYDTYLIFYSLTEIIPTLAVILVIRSALPPRSRQLSINETTPITANAHMRETTE